jgi:ferredoxin-NADP reductase/predicted pyridoxine 5'-phosphate oxidase superfamily flavin-nucleotide-binding protein
VGEPGFVGAGDERSLTIAALPTPADALEGALQPGADLGLLGIELATRRRNRVNGRVGQVGSDGLVFEVDQSFGNCPQHIQPREWQRVDPAEARPEVRRVDRIDERIRAWIESADTFFIASGHRGEGEDASFGMDASHRGGPEGFVRVTGAHELVFPDYAGNNHFNTLGNLVLDPRVGLLFVDFEKGGLLQLTGRATIDWSPPGEAASGFEGEQRRVRVRIEEAIERPGVLPLRWRAPVLPARELRVFERIRESAEVTSFVLGDAAGEPLPDFEAGQHLPIEVEPSPGTRLTRTYSLSNGPGQGVYRISVKREERGVASSWLHSEIGVGDRLRARPPAGDFVLGHEGTRPIVLVSAGVGVTPMASMLHALVASGDPREVVFVHSARDGEHHALADEIDRLAAEHPRVRRHVVYSRPTPRDRREARMDSVGRLDAARLLALAGTSDADFYLCGPMGFLSEIESGLLAAGVEHGRVAFESFGQVGVSVASAGAVGADPLAAADPGPSDLGPAGAVS